MQVKQKLIEQRSFCSHNTLRSLARIFNSMCNFIALDKCYEMYPSWFGILIQVIGDVTCQHNNDTGHAFCVQLEQLNFYV